jgi:hypothetical protein
VKKMLPAAPSPLVSIQMTSPAVAHLGVAAEAPAAEEVVAASEAAGIIAAATAKAAKPIIRRPG